MNAQTQLNTQLETHKLSRDILIGLGEISGVVHALGDDFVINQVEDIRQKAKCLEAVYRPKGSQLEAIVAGHRADFIGQLEWIAHKFCGTDIYDKEWEEEELNLFYLALQSVAVKADVYRTAKEQTKILAIKGEK